MLKNNLTKNQKIQEVQYKTPYHWFKKDDTYDGRLYFDYLRRALDVLNNFVDKSDLSVADFGCGDGRLLGMLQDSGVKKITGVDYSEDAIGFARLFVPNATYLIQDFTQKLDVQDAQFDVIFLIETLEHIPPDRIQVLVSEIFRVLRPGGVFVITVPSDKIPVHPKHYQHFNTDKIHEILNDFSKIEIRGQDSQAPSILNLLYKLLDNRYWLIKPAAKWFNQKIWPSFCGKSSLENAGRFIVFAHKD